MRTSWQPLKGSVYGLVAKFRWACHATCHNIFIYQPIFTIFAAKKISNKQAINAIKKINKKFNKTIWTNILNFFFKHLN